MKAMIYMIEFEDREDFGDFVGIDFYLRKFISPIRLEVGDKIALGHSSFDRVRFSNQISRDDIDEMMEFLFKKSIKASKYLAYFEISDIEYSHHWNDDEEGFNFHGTIILKGK